MCYKTEQTLKKYKKAIVVINLFKKNLNSKQVKERGKKEEKYTEQIENK